MSISIDGIEYKAGKIDARKQFHIVRRLAPVMSSIAPEASKGGDVFSAMADAISKLSDDDADYVIFGLLETVTRKQPNGLGWAKCTTGKVLVFDDIGMSAMLKLAYHSFQENMTDFFSVFQSALNGQNPAQNEQ
jgi:hypothetical protein